MNVSEWLVLVVVLAVIAFVSVAHGRVGDQFSARWSKTPWAGRWGVYILLIVAALLLPYSGLAPIMSPDSDWPTILFYPIGVFVLLAIGLNVVVGYAGLLDLGYVAFWAIGAYWMAELSTRYHWS